VKFSAGLYLPLDRKKEKERYEVVRKKGGGPLKDRCFSNALGPISAEERERGKGNA